LGRAPVPAFGDGLTTFRETVARTFGGRRPIAGITRVCAGQPSQRAAGDWCRSCSSAAEGRIRST